MTLIAIDAGHGLHTAGKRCLKSIDPNETRENVLNRRIADMVQDKLACYWCQTIRVDDPTGEVDIPLARRVRTANEAGADVYISIHHNAGINGGSGGGIVVIVAPHASQHSRVIQNAVYERTVARTGLRGNRANPMPEQSLYVLNHTTMPAVLGEFGFMDSTVDTPIILTEEFAEQVAQGIAEALVEEYELEIREEDEDMAPRYNTVAEIHDAAVWAVPTIRKMIDKKYITGGGKKDADGDPADMNLSMDMIRMLVMLNAAGAFG